MRFYIKTLGCPKNTVDSEMIATLLEEAGHQAVPHPRQADIVIVNTCGFIRDAREESYQALAKFAARKRRGQKLVAAGCLAQREGAEIRRRVPGVDALIGARNWSEIISLCERLEAGATHLDWVRPEGNLIASVPRRALLGRTAYIKIADGCDAACAFCAIPLIKGPYRSKPLAEVLREAQELARQGVREIVLIAQDTTAYGRDLGLRDGLPTLLRAIAEAVPEIAWLRILYAYPQHVTPALIEAMATLPQVCHYLDLPLQHGHPETLRRMRRPYDLHQVYDLVGALRAAMPDIALRSTFIVGYPGETEQEFEGLLEFMRAIAFDRVGVFCYSAEKGTPAAELPNPVSAEEMAERYDRAMRLQEEISLTRNRAQVGREIDVLIEGAADGLSVGRSYREAPEIDGFVLLPGEHAVGEFLRARIVRAETHDLVARACPG
ncbi:MAG: 30S ribosomal protein S12 methylthiotransferase RimO [Chloroflexi bacterium]|nr:30S ribosomal protein S12 methylthiotransferase RimO [Chloroflexota bacterium]